MTEKLVLCSKEEFLGWLDDPVTRLVRQLLQRKRQLLKDRWESGSLTDWEKNTHVILNAAAIGECKAYAWLTELEFDDLEGEMDDEPKRPETVG